MIYEQAAKLLAEHAPDLILDPPVPGLQHVNLRKTEGGPPFSIMLPQIMGEDAADVQRQEQEMFLSAVNSAKSML